MKINRASKRRGKETENADQSAQEKTEIILKTERKQREYGEE